MTVDPAAVELYVRLKMIRIIITILVISLITLSCKKNSPAPSAGKKLIYLMDSLPTSFEGWKIQPQSGGSSTYGQSSRFIIKLNGKQPGKAVKDLRLAIESKLKKMNFNIIGRGNSSSGGELTGFSMTVSDAESVGSFAVSAAETNKDEMIAVIAVAQIGKQSEQVAASDR